MNTSETQPFQTRPCPGCSTTEKINLPAVVGPKTGEAFTFKELSEHWRGFFKEKPFFSYHRCKQCGVLFNQTYFSDEQLNYLYANMPDNTAGLEEALLRKTQEGYFNFLANNSDLTGDFLEVGPDIGLFTEFALKNGRFEKYWLFEPNIAVHDKLKSLSKTKNISVSGEMLDFSSVADNSISVAVMIHVVDHLLSPKEIFTQLHKKLKPGGIILSVTHDEQSVLAKILGPRWPAYCLQHPQLYSPKTLSQTLQRQGFKTVKVARAYNFFPAPYLIQHLLFALGFGNFKVPWQNKFWLPLKLGNFMLIAKKTELSAA